MEKLYAKISEQQSAILQHQSDMRKASDEDAVHTRALDHQSSCSSLPITPATDGFPSSQTAPTTRPASAAQNETQASTEEVLRLKLELAQAHNHISRLESQNRYGLESGRVTPALGVVESDFASSITGAVSPIARALSGGPTCGSSAKLPYLREPGWLVPDDARAEIPEPMSTGGMSRARGIWNKQPSYPSQFPQTTAVTGAPQATPWTDPRAPTAGYETSYNHTGLEVYRQDRAPPDQDMMRPMGRRTNRYDSRYTPSSNYSGGFNMNAGPYDSTALSYPYGNQAPMAGGMGLGMYPPYPQQQVGSPLSPHATEFTSSSQGPWGKTEVSFKRAIA